MRRTSRRTRRRTRMRRRRTRRRRRRTTRRRRRRTMTLSHRCTVAWVTQPEAPEGREGRYQAGPNLEVGARRAPILLVMNIVPWPKSNFPTNFKNRHCLATES